MEVRSEDDEEVVSEIERSTKRKNTDSFMMICWGASGLIASYLKAIGSFPMKKRNAIANPSIQSKSYLGNKKITVN